MELRIRQAGRDDAAFLAWLILTAGRAHDFEREIGSPGMVRLVCDL